MFLAHQSVADLKDCPADLNGDAVVGAVVENTKFKLVYRLQDPDTAEWVAKMSGTILVDDETRYVEANKTLSEVVDDKRNIRLAERQYVDTNMLLNLPSFVSYIFTTNDVPKPSLISPIKVQKQQLVTFDETLTTQTSLDDEHIDDVIPMDEIEEDEEPETVEKLSREDKPQQLMDKDLEEVFPISIKNTDHKELKSQAKSLAKIIKSPI